jgi:hypothetical protein
MPKENDSYRCLNCGPPGTAPLQPEVKTEPPPLKECNFGFGKSCDCLECIAYRTTDPLRGDCHFYGRENVEIGRLFAEDTPDGRVRQAMCESCVNVCKAKMKLMSGKEPKETQVMNRKADEYPCTGRMFWKLRHALAIEDKSKRPPHKWEVTSIIPAEGTTREYFEIRAKCMLCSLTKGDHVNNVAEALTSNYRFSDAAYHQMGVRPPKGGVRKAFLALGRVIKAPFRWLATPLRGIVNWYRWGTGWMVTGIVGVLAVIGTGASVTIYNETVVKCETRTMSGTIKNIKIYDSHWLVSFDGQTYHKAETGGGGVQKGQPGYICQNGHLHAEKQITNQPQEQPIGKDDAQEGKESKGTGKAQDTGEKEGASKTQVPADQSEEDFQY